MDLITYALLQGSGGGGGGTSDYDDLSNQPKVNNITLVGNKNAADLNLIDPSVVSDNEFDETQTYAVGDIVIHNAKIYKFTSPHTANTPWNDAEVTEIDIMSIVDSIPGAIRISQAEYNALPAAEKEDLTKIYYVYDAPSPSGDVVIDDTTTAADKVWSSQKTASEIAQAGGGAEIDDNTTSLSKVWSSQKVSTELSSRVTTTDLTTALDDYVPMASVGVADGIAPLDASGKVADSYINDLTTAQINALKALTDD